MRSRQLVRLAALLHDVGHGPFSHAAEDLLPKSFSGSQYTHEDYSVAVVRRHFRDVIENHGFNTSNYGFRADDIAALLEGSQEAEQNIFWRDLIGSQMDADRMDYLLRDSYHAGVQYGRFDLERLASTVCAVPGQGGSRTLTGRAGGMTPRRRGIGACTALYVHASLFPQDTTGVRYTSSSLSQVAAPKRPISEARGKRSVSLPGMGRLEGLGIVVGWERRRARPETCRARSLSRDISHS